MDSILTSIKDMLGITKEYEVFDGQLIRHINSAIMVLTQNGIGPVEGYFISNDLDTWDEFLQGRKDLEAVKTYIYIRVKLVFDPPSSSSVLAALKEEAKELEWRLNIQA